MTTTGRCFCGATSWAFDGPERWACFCHCDDCRRNCSAPVVAWLGVAAEAFRWTGAPVKTLNSSPGVYRHFCDACGAPMGFEADHYPGGMHLYAASLDDPTAFKPTFHVNWEARLPWLPMDDDLLKYPRTLLHADGVDWEYR